jgi:hypothetical protein
MHTATQAQVAILESELTLEAPLDMDLDILGVLDMADLETVTAMPLLQPVQAEVDSAVAIRMEAVDIILVEVMGTQVGSEIMVAILEELDLGIQEDLAAIQEDLAAILEDLAAIMDFILVVIHMAARFLVTVEAVFDLVMELPLKAKRALAQVLKTNPPLNSKSTFRCS